MIDLRSRFLRGTKLFFAAIFVCALVPAPVALAEPAAADTSTTSSTPEQRVVKVGYMNTPGMLSCNDKGVYSGYTYEYLRGIAQFTGWTYEFVAAQGADENERAMDLLRMLDEGEVDIEGSMSYSPALGDMYEYPQNCYGTAHTSLFVPDSNAAITSTNLFTKDTSRIAILGTAKQRREELSYFCDKNNVDYTTVECASKKDMISKVNSGEADAFLDIDISPVEGFHVISTFAGRPYFFAAPKGDRTIIDEIDRTIEYINESNPKRQNTLYEEFFVETGNNFSLSDDELAFARNHETLRVGIVAEKAPIQSFDKDSGELKGVTQGILDYLSEQTGLTFEAVRIEKSDDIAASLREADIDIVAGIDGNDKVASLLSVSLTAPYMNTSLLLTYNKFVNPDELADKKLAVSWDLVATVNGNTDIAVYDSVEECFEAVNDGRADYTYGTTYTSPYYSNTKGLNNLLSLPASANPVQVGFGIVQPIEPELLAIINKTIRGLSTEQLNSITYENTLIDPTEQLSTFFGDHALGIAFVCISILVLVIVLLALYLHARGRAAHQIRNENARFQQLYSLANEQFFEYSAADDTLIISNPQKLDESLTLDSDERSENGSSLTVRHAHARIADWDNPELLDAITSPQQDVTDLRCQMPSGETHWLRVTSRLATNEEGAPLSVIGKVSNIDEEMRNRLDLSNRAQHDGLTGLLNWETFQEQAGDLIGHGHAGALLIMDADDFKLVNDTYGHPSGDSALRQIAEALKHSFRPSDLIGRIGGDEFAICLRGSMSSDMIAERCNGIIQRGMSFEDEGGEQRTFTTSIGGVELPAAEGVSYRAAYQQADQALYQAKRSGKNHTVLVRYKDGEQD